MDLRGVAELEHILEFAEGLDVSRESERKGSEVRRTVDGFETQRATDTGRQVAREVAEGLVTPAIARSRGIQKD
jgi:hypothetical protein